MKGETSAMMLAAYFGFIVAHEKKNQTLGLVKKVKNMIVIRGGL